VRQYQKFFEMEEASLQYSDEALREIATRALEKDTGVRAVRAILESILIDVLFELPEDGKNKTFKLTPEVVRGEASLLPSLMKKKGSKRESA
jgi:ATP-dependent Clp protease ATP-binding subunit ClpX